MTGPVTGIMIDIKDDGRIFVSATEWRTEGELWAVEPHQVSLADARTAAKALGPEVLDGFDARMRGNREHLLEKVKGRAAAVARVIEAQAALDDLDEMILEMRSEGGA